MNEKSIKIEKIEQISINVKDMKKAVEFYMGILELELKFTAGNMAFLDCGGNTIMLSVPENEEFDHRSSVLYFKVKNIKESFQLLKDRGVKFRGNPHIVHKTTTMENWMVFFEDIDNNVLALTSYEMLS
ncbi:VOC family protein [Paenibacillus sp. FSL K6-0276]|uniref:VOC family protein n=1 Tax=unclassified Paenibacillus TaxID=185978 RepID=UPI0028A8C93F|nr:VOC family protein [Paenibacillus sp.]